MREYRDRMVQEMVTCTCDRCSKRMSPDDDPGEWYEKVSFDGRGGIDSIFGVPMCALIFASSVSAIRWGPGCGSIRRPQQTI